jgi:hypothetical protein
MGNWISYQERALGRIRFSDNGTNKFIFIAEGLEALATLFSLEPTDEIEIEGRGMPYKEFQQDYLRVISAFYPTEDAWFLKNERAKTLDEVR